MNWWSEGPASIPSPVTQKAPIIRLYDNGQALIEEYRWGLVPSWSKTMINARSETVAKLPAFRSAFKFRRCLVIADGFYEWIQTVKPKQPLRFVLRDREMPMLFGGIWETWPHVRRHTLWPVFVGQVEIRITTAGDVRLRS